jgi:hypothetical protein
VTARSRASLLVAVTLFGLAACARPVQVDSHWHDQSQRGQSFSRILVVVVSPRPAERCSFERLLAAEIRSDTTHAMSSCSALPEGEAPGRENIEQAVAERRFDSVMVTSLVAASQRVQEGGTSETRGDRFFKPAGIDYDWGLYDWGHYGLNPFYGGPVVYGEFETSPPLKVVEGDVTMVTRFFDTRGAALVYEATIQARELHSRVEALATVAPEIAARLRKDGLIR